MKKPIVSRDLLKLQFLSDPQISPDGKQVVYAKTHIDESHRAYKTDLYLAQVDAKQSERLVVGAGNPVWSPDGRQLVFVSDRSGSRQLWLLNDGFGEAEKLTSMRWGVSNPQWSPDGKRILFISAVGKEDTPELLRKELGKDEREQLKQEQLDQAYVVDTLRYKMNGLGLLPKRTGQIFVLDLASKEVKQLTSGEYTLNAPNWSPCGEYIAFVSNRQEDPELHPNFSDLYVIPSAGGEMVKLTASNGSTSSPIWSLDGQQLVYLWHDRQYGGATLPKFYRISAQGGDPVCLNTEMELSIGVSANGDSRYGNGSMKPVWATNGYIYFAAADTGYANLYRIPAEGGTIEQVSQLQGAIYSFSFDNQGKRAALALTDSLNPGDLYVFDLVGKENVRLTEVNADLLSTLALSTPEEFNCPSFDGTNIQGWIMKPVNFEPDKKYATILEIHGGPHTMFGDSFFFEMQLLCSLGYVVVFTNPRGSHGYGQKFVDGCRGDYGGGDYQDLMAAMDYVIANVPYIDEKRLGVTGGSYGGFMTNWIVGQTDRFQAAVTQRSISNWTSFTGASDIGSYFTEDEHKANAWDNPDAMVKFSPLTYAKNVVTPLLILHGEEDIRCPIEQAEQLYVFLKRMGKTTQMVRFPVSNHELSRSGRPLLRIARLDAMTGWFEQYIPRA